jgi:hypothetical protein
LLEAQTQSKVAVEYEYGQVQMEEASSSSSSHQVSTASTLSEALEDIKVEITRLRLDKKEVLAKIDSLKNEGKNIDAKVAEKITERKTIEDRIKEQKAAAKASAKNKAKSKSKDESKMTEAEKKYQTLLASDAEVSKMIREANATTRKNRALNIVSDFDDTRVQKHMEYNNLRKEAITNLMLKGVEADKKSIDKEITMIRIGRQYDEEHGEADGEKIDVKDFIRNRNNFDDNKGGEEHIEITLNEKEEEKEEAEEETSGQVLETEVSEKEEEGEKEERKKAMLMKCKLKALFPGIHVDSDLEEAKEEEEEEEASGQVLETEVSEKEEEGEIKEGTDGEEDDDEVVSREKLEKMTKQQLHDFLAAHGKRVNNKNILKGNLVNLIIREGLDKMPKSTSDGDETVIKINWKGSRSGEIRSFTATPSTKVEDFMQKVFAEYHFDIDDVNFDEEVDYTASHNMILLPNGKLMADREKCLGDYGLKGGNDIAYVISFKLGLKGGVGAKRGIKGTITWDAETAGKLDRVSPVSQTILNYNMDNDAVERFFTALNNNQVLEMVKLWDSGKMPNKYKFQYMLNMEPNVAYIEEASDTLDHISSQFKEKFYTAFTPDSVKEELKIQMRARRLVQAAVDAVVG